MSYSVLRIIYDWPRPWDGLSPAPYYLTKHQVNLGDKVTVFCGRWPKSGGVEKIDGVRITSFPREPIRGLMLLTTAPIMSLYFLLWRIFNRVDVYHVHGHFGFYIYIYKLLFGKLDGTPLVAHFHNTTKGRIEINKARKTKDPFLIRFIETPLSLLSDKLAVRAADACIFVSKRNLEEAVEYYGVSREKSHVVESGVATEVFTPGDRVDVGKGLVEMLYVGALSQRKNINKIIESLSFLPKRYVLNIIGRGYESYTNHLKSLAERKGVGERVNFLGYKEYMELREFYERSAVFIIPSLYEGLPKVVLEALASGVPVIASGFNIKSPIKGLHFLDKPTGRKIAKMVGDIVKSKEAVDVSYVEKFYSWQAKAKEVQNIYSVIIRK